MIIIGDGSTEKYSEKIQKPVVDVRIEDIESLSILGKIKQKFYSNQIMASIGGKLGNIFDAKDKLDLIRSIATRLAEVENTILLSLEIDDNNRDNGGNKDNLETRVESQIGSIPAVLVPSIPNATLVPMVDKNESVSASPQISSTSLSNLTIVPMISHSDSISNNYNINVSNSTSSRSSNSSSSNSSSSSSSSSSNSSSDGVGIGIGGSAGPTVYKSVSLGSSGASSAAPVYSAKPSAFKNMQAAVRQEIGSGPGSNRGGGGGGGDMRKPHEKKSGCPCCDPDNVDNIIDKLMFFDA